MFIEISKDEERNLDDEFDTLSATNALQLDNP
jgi:hypothetical protein